VAEHLRTLFHSDWQPIGQALDDFAQGKPALAECYSPVDGFRQYRRRICRISTPQRRIAELDITEPSFGNCLDVGQRSSRALPMERIDEQPGSWPIDLR